MKQFFFPREFDEPFLSPALYEKIFWKQTVFRPVNNKRAWIKRVSQNVLRESWKQISTSMWVNFNVWSSLFTFSSSFALANGSHRYGHHLWSLNTEKLNIVVFSWIKILILQLWTQIYQFNINRLMQKTCRGFSCLFLLKEEFIFSIVFLVNFGHLCKMQEAWKKILSKNNLERKKFF